MVLNLSTERIHLTAEECDAIIKLALTESGGNCDLAVMRDLCDLGLAEVNPATRRVGLTADGAEAYRQMINSVNRAALPATDGGPNGSGIQIHADRNKTRR